jgi:hypothetical protein
LRDERDRREVPRGVVRTLRRELGRNGKGPGKAEEQRVAVGRAVRNELGADEARRAGAVIDDDLLPQRLTEPLRHHARDYVDGTSRRRRREHAYRPAGVARVGRGLRRGERACAHHCEPCNFHKQAYQRSLLVGGSGGRRRPLFVGVKYTIGAAPKPLPNEC